MTTTTAERQRQHRGPAILSAGFRPFFLAGAIWAVIAMAGWILALSGNGLLDRAAFAPLDWHAHEMIFGFAAAIVCGFLLTAIPNWTGRLPVTGKPLLAMFSLWLLGRVAVALGGAWPAWLVAACDLAFLAALCGIVGREIVAGRNWRNVPVLALCLAILSGNLAFHLSAQAGAAATGAGTRLAVAALVLLVALIGGRVVPSFTRNWLARQAPGPLPVATNRADMAALAVATAALLAWVAAPDGPITGGAMIAAGAGQAWRMARWRGWRGWRTLGEPLVTVLHAAFLFVPVGFLLTGLAAFSSAVPTAAGMHAWLAGAVGLMTLAMMTRASLGHTGRELHARKAETAIFLLVGAGALLRIAGSFTGSNVTIEAAGLAWIGAYALYALTYWPILTRPRVAPKAPSPRPGRK